MHPDTLHPRTHEPPNLRVLTPSFPLDTVRDWPVEAGALHGVVSSDFRARAPGCPRRPDIGAAGAAAPRSAAAILLGSALRARAAESASPAARSGSRRRAGRAHRARRSPDHIHSAVVAQALSPFRGEQSPCPRPTISLSSAPAPAATWPPSVRANSG